MKTVMTLLSIALIAGSAFANLPIPTQLTLSASVPVATPEIMPSNQGLSCGPLLGSCPAIAPDICDCDEPVVVGTCEDFNGRSWYIADCGHPVEYCNLQINCIP